MLLSTHYRTQLNFTFDGLEAARATLTRLSDFVERLKKVEGGEDGVDEILERTESSFKAALGDDLNISQALAALFEMVRSVNQLCDQNRLSTEGATNVLDLLKRFDTVLGFIPFEKEELDVPKELLEALQKRESARHEKNWSEADKQRDLITAAGFVIEDTPSGPQLKRK